MAEEQQESSQGEMEGERNSRNAKYPTKRRGRFFVSSGARVRASVRSAFEPLPSP